MSINKQHIASEIQKIVESLGFLFIELIIRGGQRQQVFELFIDNELGVTAVDCAEVSRSINEFFELDDQGIENYRLDVSSPGVERSLKYFLQYKKHIGRSFQVKYELEDEVKNQKGNLIKAENEKLLFQFGKEEILIPFDKIKEAKAQISF